MVLRCDSKIAYIFTRSGYRADSALTRWCSAREPPPHYYLRPRHRFLGAAASPTPPFVGPHAHRLLPHARDPPTPQRPVAVAHTACTSQLATTSQAATRAPALSAGRIDPRGAVGGARRIPRQPARVARTRSHVIAGRARAHPCCAGSAGPKRAAAGGGQRAVCGVRTRHRGADDGRAALAPLSKRYVLRRLHLRKAGARLP